VIDPVSFSIFMCGSIFVTYAERMLVMNAASGCLPGCLSHASIESKLMTVESCSFYLR